jgi:hypothetical protein
MYILDFKINSRGWARIEIYVEKHKRLKKIYYRKKEYMENYKRVEASYIVSVKYIFFQQFHGDSKLL